MSEEQQRAPAAVVTPEHLASLQALAKQAAAWWRNQLEDPGYAGKFNNGDRSQAGEMAQIMASMAALQSPSPKSPALDLFEQLLTDALWSRMERDPIPSEPECASPANDIVLSVDYGPEGELRKAASSASVSGFPWKTTMWVNWDADPAKCYIEVRRGYGAENQRLPTTR
ncbi:MAG: hypothetical protein ACRYF0_17550 [Janthinobacterium lividum]